MHQAGKASRSCRRCGCYCHEERGVYGLKTRRFADPFLLNSRGHLANLQLRAAAFAAVDASRVNPLVSDVVAQLAEHFRLGLTTFAKGQYMLFHLLHERPEFQDQQLRYGAVCLYLSAKMTESQSAIPNLGRYCQQAHRIFEKHEYAALEEQVLEHVYERIFSVGFFTEFLEHYLVKGVVLSDERVDPALLPEVEARVLGAALNYIRTGEFLVHPQEKLAAFVLHQARQELRVAEVWNEHVESYTGFGTLEIYNVLKECRRKVVSDVPSYKRIVVKQPSGNSTVVKHSTSTNSTNSSLSGEGRQLQPVGSTAGSTSSSRLSTLMRSASVKSRLLAQPFRGVVKVLL